MFRFKMEIQDNTRMRTDYLTGATGKKLNKENLRDNISITLETTDENYKGSGQTLSSTKSRGSAEILLCVKGKRGPLFPELILITHILDRWAWTRDNYPSNGKDKISIK